MNALAGCVTRPLLPFAPRQTGGMVSGSPQPMAMVLPASDTPHFFAHRPRFHHLLPGIAQPADATDFAQQGGALLIGFC